MKYCRSCRSFAPSGEELERDDPEILNQKVKVGECRRYAPRPATVAELGTKVMNAWPTVASDYGCGEWDPAFE